MCPLPIIFLFQGKSSDIALVSESDTFEQNGSDVLKLQIEPVGLVSKIRVWHNNKGLRCDVM